jgi:hypothetical protein
MSNADMLRALHEAFPDETIQLRQRLRRHQVETLNMIVSELKARNAGIEALRKSARP